MREKHAIRFTSRWIKRRFSALFDQVADPVIRLQEEDILAHQVATYAYYPITRRPLAVSGYRLDADFSNVGQVCLYVNEIRRDCLIGYRGTDIGNFHDLASDVELLLGVSGLDPRIEQSLVLYDAVRERYPAYTKRICGHSLGGTICYLVAKHREPKRCTVFNPGSAPNPLFIQMLTDTLQGAAWTRGVYSYKILGDLLSTFSVVGTTKVFRIASLDPEVLHRLDNFAPPGVVYAPVIGVG